MVEIAIGRADLVLLGELEDMVAARGNRRHVRIDAIDARVGVHVQFGDEAASDQAHSHFRHRRAPSVEEASYRNDGTRSCGVGKARAYTPAIHSHGAAPCPRGHYHRESALGTIGIRVGKTGPRWCLTATPRRAIPDRSRGQVLPTLQAE